MPPRSSRRSQRAAIPTSGQASKSPSGDSQAPGSPTSPKDDAGKAADEGRSRRGKTREVSNNRSDDKSTSRSSKPTTPPNPVEDEGQPPEEDEEPGVTQCVCDESDDESKGFMIQCEQCNKWQHGLCIGYEHEEDCPEEYYCYDCHPELHEKLLARLQAEGPKQRERKKVKSQPPPSIASSRSERSRSPDQLKAPKRRNTMNSRDAGLEAAIEASRLEAERADIPFGETEGATTRRKRKRTGDDLESSRRKRSAGSPELESPTGEPSTSKPRASTAKQAGNTTPSTPVEAGAPDNTYSRSRRTSRKEKELSQELDSKNKHANQYTYRPPKTSQTPIKRSGPSGSTNGPSHDHGTRRNPPQSRAAASPSPVPLSWNVPDHLSHLAPLLPTPSPIGVNVNVGGDVKVVEKGVRVRWPGKRTTIGEMRRRVRGMMEFVARAQLEAGERERRGDMLRAAIAEAEDPANNEEEAPPLPTGAEQDITMADVDADQVDVKPTTIGEAIFDLGSIPKIEDGESSVPFPTSSQPLGSTDPPHVLPPSHRQSTERTTPAPRHTPLPPTPPQQPSVTTTQLLDELTRELIQFQERFGAAKEGKVYRERTDRERRTRGSGGLGLLGEVSAGYSL